jgi:hypothetical protein
MGFFSKVKQTAKKAFSDPLSKEGLLATSVGASALPITGLAAKALGGADIPGASIPGMSPEETAILRQQQELLERFTPIFGDFAADVIQGKVPVSPQLEQQLGQQEATIREDIARRTGSSGAALTTAGIQRLGQFQQGANIAREEARRSLIPQAFQAVGTLGGLAESALSPLQRLREQQTQISLQQQQEAAARKSQQRGMFGQILGGAVSGGLVGGVPGALLGAAGGTSLLPTLLGQQKKPGAGTISPPKIKPQNIGGFVTG